MLRPQVLVEESMAWALGWEIQRTPHGDVIQHQGGQTGVQAFTRASVERRSGFVILTNGDNGWKVFYNQQFSQVMNRILFA